METYCCLVHWTEHDGHWQRNYGIFCSSLTWVTLLNTQSLMKERLNSFCFLEAIQHVIVCFTNLNLYSRPLDEEYRGRGGIMSILWKELIDFRCLAEFSECFALHTLHAMMKFIACLRGQTFQKGTHIMTNW